MLPGRRDGVGRLFVKSTPPPPFNSAFMGGIALSPLGQVQIATAPANAYDAVTLNGVAGTGVSTPNSAANSITGDIDIRVKAAVTDWTPAAANALVSKRSAASGEYFFLIDASGKLDLLWYGTGATLRQCQSTVSPTVADGATLWVRATRDVAGLVVTFYTSSDGATWTILGTPVAFTAFTPATTTVNVSIGVDGDLSSTPLSGKIYEAEIRNGINGPVAVSFDASN